MSVNYGPKRTEQPFNEVVFDEIVEDELVVQGPVVADSLTVGPTQSPLAYSGGAVWGTATIQGPPPSGDTTGATDTPILQALLGSGSVWIRLQPGTYWINNVLTYFTLTRLVGAGRSITVIKLANGSNCDMFVSNGFAALTGGGTTGGVVECGFADLTIDGNKANNASGGRGIKHYGAMIELDHVIVRSCKSDNIWSEWSSNGLLTDGCEGHVHGLVSHDSDGWGVVWAGPHDSQWVNVQVFQNAHGVWVKPSGSILTVTNGHSWGLAQDYGWYCEGVTILNASQGEGASVAQVALLVNECTIEGGKYFAAGGTGKGILVGDATHTPITGTHVNTKVNDCVNGAIDLTYSGGTEYIELLVFQTSGAARLGTPALNGYYNITVIGGATTGGTQFPHSITHLSGQSVSFSAGNGSPEGVLTAQVGSAFLRLDGGIGTSFYTKETGSGNTGWRAQGFLGINLPNLAMAFDPRAPGSTVANIGTANHCRGARVIVPKTGTLAGLAVYLAATGGNIEVGVLGTAVSGGNRTRLYTTGSIVAPAGNAWTEVGTPGLAVSQGDQLDFYIGADSLTPTFMRSPIAAANAAQLPAGYDTVVGGAAAILCWDATAYPMGANPTEASLTPTPVAMLVVGRIT